MVERAWSLADGPVVPMPTLPEASTTTGVVSVSVPSSLTRSDRPVPALVIIRGTAALATPETVDLNSVPVLAALFPESVISCIVPVKPVAEELKDKSFPEVILVEPRAIAVSVVKVSQFQAWAKLALAMVLAAIAAVIADKADEAEIPPGAVQESVPAPLLVST